MGKICIEVIRHGLLEFSGKDNHILTNVVRMKWKSFHKRTRKRTINARVRLFKTNHKMERKWVIDLPLTAKENNTDNSIGTLKSVPILTFCGIIRVIIFFYKCEYLVII